MRKTCRQVWEQLQLFQPTSQRPTWKSLPKEIHRKVLPLLARLLRTDRGRNAVAAAKEVGDE
jgi:hypothetical protein